MHPGIDDLLRDDDVGLRERRLGGRRVTGLPVEAVVVGLALEVGADHRRRRVERRAGIDDRVKRVVVDVDQLERVARRVPVFGDDERHLLALEAHLVGGQHGLHVVGQRRHPGQALLGQVGAGDDRFDLRMCLGRSHIDADDAGVRIRRAQDRQVQHARQRDVVDVVAAAPDESRVLFAQHPAVAHTAFGRCRRCLPVRADGALDRVVMTLPPLRCAMLGRPLDGAHDRGVAGAPADLPGDRLPDRLLVRVGVAVQQGRAVIIIPGVQKPHCRPWQRMKPSCTGSSWPFTARPSTVRTLWPEAITASMVQDFTGTPSTSTTQVPQLLVSQPQ